MEEPKKIELRFEPECLIFSVGGEEFFLSRADALLLFGQDIANEFETAAFGGLRTLSNFVKIQRLMKKGLNYSQIGKVLNHPESKIKEFYGHEMSRPRVERFNINAIENERQKQAAMEVDFVREAPRPRSMNEQEDPKPGEKFVDLLRVKNLMGEHIKTERIADHLGLDRKEFEKFMEKNQRYLA